MKWRRGQGGGQIEDRRGQGGYAGGGFPIPGGRGGAGLGGLGIVGVIVAILFATGVFGGGGGGLGIDPGLSPLPQAPAAQSGDPFGGAPDPDAELRDFMGFVISDVQATWEDIFREGGRRYQPTTLVLFTDATGTGCGQGSAATGPFYCPADGKVYLDLGFFRELQSRFGASGDFAQAYVVAHEVGHHVQKLLGLNEQVTRASQENPANANEYSIRLELQADCFAGVWAHSAYQDNLLEQGDLGEGLAAAAAVGDDRIQEQTQGRINPETWTHGSSEQRTEWFQRGFDSGDPNGCDTFT